jgi:ABC-type uncharacterized transport system substrate-binding protein
MGTVARGRCRLLPVNLAATGLVLVVAVLLGGCQLIRSIGPSNKVPTIGYVSAGTPESGATNVETFRQSLRDHGYVEGENFLLEVRYADGRMERIPDLVGELLGQPVDVLVVVATQASLAAQRASSTIPIVFVSVSDPVASGLVQSLAHPGGNLTGLTSTAPALNPKRLQLLKDVLPHVTRVATLRDANTPLTPAQQPSGLAEAAASLGIQLQTVSARGPEGLPAALLEMVAGGAEAFIDTGCPMTCTHARQVVQLAAEHRLPAIYQFDAFMDAGGLMAYGVNEQAMFRRAGAYVDKILRGGTPADLPVEQPTEFKFVINLRPAEAFGLTIPRRVLVQATDILR